MMTRLAIFLPIVLYMPPFILFTIFSPKQLKFNELLLLILILLLLILILGASGNRIKFRLE
jgi:hypothetical protein